MRQRSCHGVGNTRTCMQDVQDTSGGCGASFSVSVVSPKFEGMKLIARHRAINTALKEEISQIHALQIAKCDVPSTN